MRRLSLRLLLAAFSLLPPRSRRLAVRILADIRYRLYYRGIRPLARNIRHYLDVPAQEAEDILRRSFELHLLGILDGKRLGSLNADRTASLIEFRGLDRLDQALADGQGLVAATAHTEGLFTAFAGLAALGYRPNPIRIGETRRQDGRLARWLGRRMDRRFERIGCRWLWMEAGSGFGVGVLALNALRRGELVLSPVDLSQTDDNAVVAFFGARVPFPRGLATLARASRAPLVNLFVYRAGSGRLTAEFGEPFEVRDVDAAVQRTATELEAAIRRHPADWCPWHLFDACPASGDPESLRSPEVAQLSGA